MKKTHQVYWRNRNCMERTIHSEGIPYVKRHATARAKHLQANYPDRIYWIENIRKS